LDFFQLLCYRSEELSCGGFSTSPPKSKIVCGRRAIRLKVPPGYFLKRQLWLYPLPAPHPSSGVHEGGRLPLPWPETNFPTIGRWFQGRTPALRENEVAYVSHPCVPGHSVSQLWAGQWPLLQH